MVQWKVLNPETEHKEGICKVLGRSVVFSAFYADFCLCSNSVIITTLNMDESISFKLVEVFLVNLF